jgi:hypothetical protein
MYNQELAPFSECHSNLHADRAIPLSRSESLFIHDSQYLSAVSPTSTLYSDGSDYDYAQSSSSSEKICLLPVPLEYAYLTQDYINFLNSQKAASFPPIPPQTDIIHSPTLPLNAYGPWLFDGVSATPLTDSTNYYAYSSSPQAVTTPPSTPELQHPKPEKANSLPSFISDTPEFTAPSTSTSSPYPYPPRLPLEDLSPSEIDDLLKNLLKMSQMTDALSSVNLDDYMSEGSTPQYCDALASGYLNEGAERKWVQEDKGGKETDADEEAFVEASLSMDAAFDGC